MSIPAAIGFLRAMRENEELRAALATYAGDLAAFAREQGFEFTDDELDRAFGIDWTARSLHYTWAASVAGANGVD